MGICKLYCICLLLDLEKLVFKVILDNFYFKGLETHNYATARHAYKRFCLKNQFPAPGRLSGRGQL